jgi:hypothetical protein
MSGFSSGGDVTQTVFVGLPLQGKTKGKTMNKNIL